MKLKIIKWNEQDRFCECYDEEGKRHFVDFQILNQEKLVSKSVEIEYIFPFLELAMGKVKIIGE